MLIVAKMNFSHSLSEPMSLPRRRAFRHNFLAGLSDQGKKCPLAGQGRNISRH
jgi:hypothetical protein